jgi:Leucine rich repeat variant
VINTAEEFVALRTSDDPEMYRRAAHDHATEDVWLEVINGYPEMRSWVVLNKTVPLSVLELLATDPDSSVRSAVAMKRKLPPALMERLADDANEGVRRAVAANKSTPPDLLRRLLSDPWDGVVEVARRRLEQLGE